MFTPERNLSPSNHPPFRTPLHMSDTSLSHHLVTLQLLQSPKSRSGSIPSTQLQEKTQKQLILHTLHTFDSKKNEHLQYTIYLYTPPPRKKKKKKKKKNLPFFPQKAIKPLQPHHENHQNRGPQLHSSLRLHPGPRRIHEDIARQALATLGAVPWMPKAKPETTLLWRRRGLFMFCRFVFIFCFDGFSIAFYIISPIKSYKHHLFGSLAITKKASMRTPREGQRTASHLLLR